MGPSVIFHMQHNISQVSSLSIVIELETFKIVIFEFTFCCFQCIPSKRLIGTELLNRVISLFNKY